MGFSRQKYWSGVPFPSPEISIENLEKLWHVPGNLECCMHVQGYACAQERPKKDQADPEALHKQEVKAKTEFGICLSECQRCFPETHRVPQQRPWGLLVPSIYSGFWGFPGGSGYRIYIPMQETWVRFLTWEDPTCCRETKPIYNYWACAGELGSHNYDTTCCSHWSPHALEPVLHSKRGLRTEKPACCNRRAAPLTTREKPTQQRRPSTARNKY